MTSRSQVMPSFTSVSSSFSVRTTATARKRLAASRTHRLVIFVTTITIFAIVVAIAIGDVMKPSHTTKMTAMEGEFKVHTDDPAIRKTFDDYTVNASMALFHPVRFELHYVALLANAKLLPYDAATSHRCIVRNSSVIYGWCEEQQAGNNSWTSTHIVIYQQVMVDMQVEAAVAAHSFLALAVTSWVMAELTTDSQTVYRAGGMGLGDVWVPGLAGVARLVECDANGFPDRMCHEQIGQAAIGAGISTFIFQQVFAVRSQSSQIAVVLIPQASTESYASATVERSLFKVMLTPRLSLWPPSCVTDPTDDDCYIVSFRRNSQENVIAVGNWRLAYWLQVTFGIVVVHLLTMGQTLGPVQRFVIILRLPTFKILTAQTILLAAQEFKVLLILRYASGWNSDVVHRLLVLTYACLVICCHAILSQHGYSVSKAEYSTLNVAVLSAGLVVAFTHWLSLPTSAPNVIQRCYYCQYYAFCSAKEAMCCTWNYLASEIGVAVATYFFWFVVSARPRHWLAKRARAAISAADASTQDFNSFERSCLNAEIVAEYRTHAVSVYTAVGEQCATTDLGLALTGYCASRDHIMRIDGVMFTSMVLLLPKWVVRLVPVTVTVWPLVGFVAPCGQLRVDGSSDDASIGRDLKLRAARTATFDDGTTVAEVEPMVVLHAHRVHIRNVNLHWGRVRRVYV